MRTSCWLEDWLFWRSSKNQLMSDSIWVSLFYLYINNSHWRTCQRQLGFSSTKHRWQPDNQILITRHLLTVLPKHIRQCHKIIEVRYEAYWSLKLSFSLSHSLLHVSSVFCFLRKECVSVLYWLLMSVCSCRMSALCAWHCMCVSDWVWVYHDLFFFSEPPNHIELRQSYDKNQNRSPFFLSPPPSLL